MKRSGLLLGRMAMVGSVALVVLAGGLVACNGLLGIQSATLGEGDAGPPAPLVEAGLTCPYYCQEITNNCTSNDTLEYQGVLSLCLSMCDSLAFDTGTLADTTGNTLGCRIHYAQLAANNPTTNCRFAGPLGGGVCQGTSADPCSNFCGIDVPYCASVQAPSYVSIQDCLNHCGADAGYAGYVFTTDGGSTGIDLPDGTNTLNCRFYHLENGWPSPRYGRTHCPHTMPISATCN